MSAPDYLSRMLPGLKPAVEGSIEAALAGERPETVEEARAAANAATELAFSTLVEAVPPLEDEVDWTVPVEGGDITVRVYTPSGRGPFPVYVYFHGGGWWMGTLEQIDDPCRRIATDVGCVVASVDYRLAPEHKFPTPLKDCVAALRWIVDHAEELDVDADRVVIGGGSAGGNLAAATALIARDEGPTIVGQLLEVPATDLTLSQPSVDENAEVPILCKADYEACVDHYLRDAADARNPLVSPMFADDLRGLPPALVMTAEFDPLRDDGEVYARLLTDAGVDTELIRWDGQFHGTQLLEMLIPDEVAAYRATIVRWLRARFDQ